MGLCLTCKAKINIENQMINRLLYLVYISTDNNLHMIVLMTKYTLT